MNVKTTALALALALPAGFSAGIAQAAPVFNSGLNDGFYQNFESIWRTAESCTTNGGCLAFDAANDPTGYQRLDGSANNIIEGDILAGIFSVQNIESGGTNIWFQSATDQFSGYFAQEVVDVINPDPGGTSVDHLLLTNPTTDPFGILSSGEMLRLFVDDGAGVTVFEHNGTTFDDINKATDGTLWASFGSGATAVDPNDGIDLDGYAYGHIDVSLTGENLSDQEALLGVDLVTAGPALTITLGDVLNDVNETESGGTGPQVSTAAQCAAGLWTCSTLIATSEIEANPAGYFAGGAEPWAIRSNDPFTVYRTVPEPATIALVGMGLLGLGVARRRRREQG